MPFSCLTCAMLLRCWSHSRPSPQPAGAHSMVVAALQANCAAASGWLAGMWQSCRAAQRVGRAHEPRSATCYSAHLCKVIWCLSAMLNSAAAFQNRVVHSSGGWFQVLPYQ
mmetsp:Transcript_37705/g.95345  ORF Transcript_37705/g.95345 Transcript_37705/m.95345 type:complete len:111 (-) Transcript_37705:502-834(-)